MRDRPKIVEKKNEIKSDSQSLNEQNPLHQNGGMSLLMEFDENVIQE